MTMIDNANSQLERADWTAEPIPREQSNVRRILFVDDDELALSALGRMVPRGTNDWELHFTTTVDDALERLRKQPFDLVVADVRMPMKDGFDLLMEMAADEGLATVPVVMVTGADDSELKRRALALGAMDLLGKPFDQEDLLARIRSALRIKGQQDEIQSQKQELARAVIDLLDSRLDIIWCLARATEYRDHIAGQHVARVAAYCVTIAGALGLDEEFTASIALAAPLHDVGKISVPDSVLNKPGMLTPAEWQIMKEHCRIGAAILNPDAGSADVFRLWHSLLWGHQPGLRAVAAALRGHADGPTVPPIGEGVQHYLRPGAVKRRNPILEMASGIALNHHERWDGTGYPLGLAGEAIPIESRIVAIADVYDALRSRRPYKPAFSEEQTIATIRGASGHHFDPEVVAALERSQDQLRDIFDSLSEHDETPYFSAA